MSFEDRNQQKIADQVSEYLSELKAREKPIQISKDSMRALTEWEQRVQPILKADRIFAQHIKGLDVWKKIIALQTVSLPEPFHTIAIGDPASGKSEVAQAFQPVTPTTRYVWATKMTSAGLTLSRMGDDLMKGELPECHMGQLFVDEFDKAPAQESGALLGSMQHGWFGIAKASLKVPYVPARAAIAAMANPLGDYWRSVHPKVIREQLPFRSQALLTRFHLIVIVRRPDVKEFQDISMHQLQAGMKHLSLNAFAEGDSEMWAQYVHYLRRVNVEGWEAPLKQQRMISAFTHAAYKQDQKFQLAIPISLRLNEGIEKIAMAYAKADFGTSVQVADTVRALHLTAETLEPCGLDAEQVWRDVRKATGVKMEGD